jgi:type III pantothenate kinase
MNKLVIDIGNSLAKLALFSGRAMIKSQTSASIDHSTIEEFIAGTEIENVILSTVRQDTEELELYLANNYNYQRFSTLIETTIKLQYKTPTTLGLDRFAAVIGAAALFPNNNCLVIDAGTCITYDFVDKAKNYFGGSISPGLTMRFKAMHTFTGKLPLIETDAGFTESFGHDTRTSILSGVQNGVLHEITGFIQAYKSQHPDLVIALCGGDANYFDTQLKNSIFAHDIRTVPNLVLIGLNEVIQQ